MRRRDTLGRDDPRWPSADDDVERAHAAYRAQVAQSAAVHAELEHEARDNPDRGLSAWYRTAVRAPEGQAPGS